MNPSSPPQATPAAPATTTPSPVSPSAEGSAAAAPKSKPTSRSRSTRLKERVFPDVRTFDTKDAGFVPLPVVLRAMLWFFTTRQWMVLTAIYMRTSKEGVCWFDVGELSHDMNLGPNGKLTIRIRELEEQHFIVKRSNGGKDYYAAVDPRDAIRILLKEGKIPAERLLAINDLLENLKQPPITPDADLDDLNKFLTSLNKGKAE